MDRGGAFVILALIPKRFGSFALTKKTEEGKQADANFSCWSTEKNEKQKAWFCQLMLHSGTPEQAEMTSGSYRRWRMTLSALFLTHTRLKTLATNTTANIQASGDVIFDLHILTATFFPQSAAHLIDPAFIDRIRRKISVNCTHENDYYTNTSPPSDHFGTTHVSVVDEDGLAVSATSTINEMWAGRCRTDPLVLCVCDPFTGPCFLRFGGAVYSPRTGVIMNNELSDFCKRADTIRAGKVTRVYPARGVT